MEWRSAHLQVRAVHGPTAFPLSLWVLASDQNTTHTSWTFRQNVEHPLKELKGGNNIEQLLKHILRESMFRYLFKCQLPCGTFLCRLMWKQGRMDLWVNMCKSDRLKIEWFAHPIHRLGIFSKTIQAGGAKAGPIKIWMTPWTGCYTCNPVQAFPLLDMVGLVFATYKSIEHHGKSPYQWRHSTCPWWQLVLAWKCSHTIGLTHMVYPKQIHKHF